MDSISAAPELATIAQQSPRYRHELAEISTLENDHALIKVATQLATQHHETKKGLARKPANPLILLERETRFELATFSLGS